ncbi:MAG TPA: hypothetical protein VD816_02600 [Ohtaekwangia sp.]|nr:hypothetical protein [Ohtaekwangia sp.]
MNKLYSAIDDFFTAYAKRFNDFLLTEELDVDGTVNSFAGFFVEANPSGVVGGNNDDKFRSAIADGYRFYRKIGAQSMTITGREITLLNELHAMARIQWRASYEKEDRRIDIDFEVIYFMQVREDQPKIFAYITGDEQKVLQEHGLV